MMRHHSSNGEIYAQRVSCLAKPQVITAAIAGGAVAVDGGFARARNTMSGRAIAAGARIGTHTNGTIFWRGSSE